MIDKARALQIAEGWGSYMNDADPGVCMYALTSTGKIQSPKHRADLIVYIKNDCMPLVRERHDHATALDDDEGEEAARVDKEELDELLEYCEGAPLESAE